VSLPHRQSRQAAPPAAGGAVGGTVDISRGAAGSIRGARLAALGIALGLAASLPALAQGPITTTPLPSTELPAVPAPGNASPMEAQPQRPNVWLPRGGAVLQALDKVNARSATLTLKVGQSTQFQTLTITLRACRVRPPDQPADAAA
jgi:hypothetical protein